MPAPSHGWLARALPDLDFTGYPVRAGVLATFSLSVAAAFGLAWLLAPGPTARLRRFGALAFAGLAGVEFWPRPFTTSHFPSPPIFAELAKDPSTFAVYEVPGA